MSVGRFAARWPRGDRAAGRSAAEDELISRLRALPGPVPEARFRADLRAQLVAITARIVSESSADAPTSQASGASASARTSRAPGSRALRTLRRPVLALAGASTVLALLLGMAVWMSSGSLPGQSMYGVKRASENVQLSMAGSDVAKGQAYLQLAGNRVREAADLLSRPAAMPAAGGLSAGTPRFSPRTTSLVGDTLDNADENTVSGMRLLSRAAVAQLSKAPLSKMTNWWPGQNTLMTEVRDRIPAGPLRTRAQASILLLQRIATRTGQLSGSLGCPCLAQALSDELGPVPCAACAATPNPAPGGGASTLPPPIPGLGGSSGPSGSSGSSGSAPNLSLPPLGGSGSSSSGRAAGPPPGMSPSAATSLPSSLTAIPPVSLPSSVPGGRPSLGPIVIGPVSLQVTLPAVVGSHAADVLPSLPGVSRP
ncbi:MAG: DUF5667 domain-containing protein [Jatrophihabitantaceae bacterium]